MSTLCERVRFFRTRIVAWGPQHGRLFPWRTTANPYELLIAELMLRRTQARQVVPIYEVFLRRFPTVQVLALASEDEIRQLVSPLGLTWRVPAFRQMAQQVMADHGGEIPRERHALLSLAGVGEYVADAVRCFAYHEPVALLDTNTVRVAGRYLGFPVHAESRRRAPVKRAVASLVNPAAPRVSNLAMLDLAAMICQPRYPLCTSCPVAECCVWRQTEFLKEESSGANDR